MCESTYDDHFIVVARPVWPISRAAATEAEPVAAMTGHPHGHNTHGPWARTSFHGQHVMPIQENGIRLIEYQNRKSLTSKRCLSLYQRRSEQAPHKGTCNAIKAHSPGGRPDLREMSVELAKLVPQRRRLKPTQSELSRILSLEMPLVFARNGCTSSKHCCEIIIACGTGKQSVSKKLGNPVTRLQNFSISEAKPLGVMHNLCGLRIS